MDTTEKTDTTDIDDLLTEVKPIRSFFKNHKRLCIAIAAVIFLCIAAIVVVSMIHSSQAKEIEQAQIGKCYITQQSKEDGHTTQVYYFTEQGLAHLYLSYDDKEMQKVGYASGSLDDFTSTQIDISLFGKITLNHREITVDDNQVITHIEGNSATVISLEEAKPLEDKIRLSEALKDACIYDCDSAIGTEGFLKRLNEKLTASKPSYKTASKEDYINAAKSLISEYLKNPSSAIYNTESLVETDDYGRAIVYLDVSAQNSFGGYVRDTYYVCIHQITGSSFTYNSIFYSVREKSQLDFLKSSNDWGTDPTAEYDLAPFTPGKPTKTETVTVGNYDLVAYTYACSKVTYVVYLEPVTGYVLSAEIIFSKDQVTQLSDEDKRILSCAISGTMQATHQYVTPQWDEVFSIENGPVRNTPFFRDDCGCMYHAILKDGKYRISVTNSGAFGFDASNYWFPTK